MRALICFLACLPACTQSLWQTTFCVVTAGRGVSYVGPTVDSFLKERVFQHDGVSLVTVDVDGSTDQGVFAVRLRDRQHARCDSPDVEGVPSCRVRQMTLDVTAALTQCANETSGWVVLSEDDCVACAGAVSEVLYVLSGLDHTVSMARFSKFSRSAAIPARKVPAFVRYARLRLYTHPYDITRVEEWDAGGGVYVHERNLFHHVGTVSTEEARNTQSFLEQYGGFRSDVCFEALA